MYAVIQKFEYIMTLYKRGTEVGYEKLFAITLLRKVKVS
jgi:hypothetical protein